MFQYVLFDLDGTLTDPKEGITKCVQFALHQQGIHEPNLDQLEPFIGPPLKDSFMEFYGMTEEQAAIGVADYRKRFAPIGIFENKVYPGIPEMLAHLKEAGMYLAIASSKPENFVLRILEHFELDSYFDVVTGSNLDGSRSTKEEVVEEALRRLRETTDEKSAAEAAERQKEAETGNGRGTLLNRTNCAMVGDRKFDIYGAKEYGLTAVGVSYGYAGKGELEEAGADYIAKTVKQLEAFLLQNGQTREGRTGHRQSVTKEADEQQTAVKGADEQQSAAKEPNEQQASDRKEAAAGYSVFHKRRLESTWCILFPFVLHYLSYHACYIVVITFIQLFCRINPAIYEWVNKNSLFAMSIVQGCSMLAAAGALLPLFRREHTARKKAAPPFYLTVGILAGTMAVGFNILFRLLYITQLSARYTETAKAQYQIPVVYGLILYGLISPLTEELLFRGLIYHRMKRYFPVKWSILLSALFFGLYHGNLVQALYGTILGTMIAYVYEVSGDFKIPVFAHAAANCVVFLMTCQADVMEAVTTPVNCVIFSFISLASLWKIRKKAES